MIGVRWYCCKSGLLLVKPLEKTQNRRLTINKNFPKLNPLPPIFQGFFNTCLILKSKLLCKLNISYYGKLKQLLFVYQYFSWFHRRRPGRVFKHQFETSKKFKNGKGLNLFPTAKQSFFFFIFMCGYAVTYCTSNYVLIRPYFVKI